MILARQDRTIIPCPSCVAALDVLNRQKIPIAIIEFAYAGSTHIFDLGAVKTGTGKVLYMPALCEARWHALTDLQSLSLNLGNAATRVSYLNGGEKEFDKFYEGLGVMVALTRTQRG